MQLAFRTKSSSSQGFKSVEEMYRRVGYLKVVGNHSALRMPGMACAPAGVDWVQECRAEPDSLRSGLVVPGSH